MILILSSVKCDEILSEDENTEIKSDSITVVATKLIAADSVAKKVPFKIIYSIYNIGKKYILYNSKLKFFRNIRDIKLVDKSFDQRYFTLKNGPIESTWDVIFPNEHVSFYTVLEPNAKLNAFNLTSATVTYFVDSEENERVLSFLIDLIISRFYVQVDMDKLF